MPLIIVVAYGFIAILAVAISGILSYKGLLSTAHEITLPLVVFIMSIVLVMDYTISYFRSTDRRIFLPIVIFFIAAFFSMASNFNYLYTNFMRDDVTHATVSSQLAIFRDDLVNTRSQILSMRTIEDANEKRTRLDLELENLRNQSSDPLRPGCGERCRQHMENIQQIIGTPITEIAIPQLGTDPQTLQDWLTRYSAAVDEAFVTSLGNTAVPALNRLADRIQTTLNDFSTAEAVIESRGGLRSLEDMRNISDDYEREANALLPETMAVDHQDIDPTLGRLGEIAYSFENGFLERPNLVATMLSLFLASVVDLLPFMLSFALFGPGRLERNVQKTGHRGRRGTARG